MIKIVLYFYGCKFFVWLLNIYLDIIKIYSDKIAHSSKIKLLSFVNLYGGWLTFTEHNNIIIILPKSWNNKLPDVERSILISGVFWNQLQNSVIQQN